MEKLFRALILGTILSIGTLIGFGWKAYAKIDQIRKEVKSEIKTEMMEIRNRDMEWMQQRFNGLETMYAGKVLSKQQDFTKDQP